LTNRVAIRGGWEINAGTPVVTKNIASLARLSHAVLAQSIDSNQADIITLSDQPARGVRLVLAADFSGMTGSSK